MTVAELISCLQQLPQNLEVRAFESISYAYIPVTNAVVCTHEAAGLLDVYIQIQTKWAKP